MADDTRKGKVIRALQVFQVYYLVLVCFLVAAGELFPGSSLRIGHRIENLLAIPLLIAVTLVALEKRLHIRFTWREGLLTAFVIFTALGLLYTPHPGVVRKGLVQVAAAAHVPDDHGFFIFGKLQEMRRQFARVAAVAQRV